MKRFGLLVNVNRSFIRRRLGVKMEKELDSLMGTLQSINIAMGGSNESDKDAKKNSHKGDQFMEIKSSMIERIHAIKKAISDISSSSKKKPKPHPREIIKKQQEVRDEVRQLDQELKDLQKSYENDTKKRKNRLSEEELTLRLDIIQQYALEVSNVKELASGGYLRNSVISITPKVGEGGESLHTRIGDFSSERSPSPRLGSKSPSYYTSNLSSPEEVTDAQRDILVQIDNNDAKLDNMVEEIGEGIQELGVLARGINQEVVKQNLMIDGLEERIDNAHSHVENVNKKMKDTLQKVGRGGDKCMMDFICLIILLGVLSVAYNIAFGSKKK